MGDALSAEDQAQAAGAWASIIPPPGWTAQQTAELGTLTAN